MTDVPPLSLYNTSTQDGGARQCVCVSLSVCVHVCVCVCGVSFLLSNLACENKCLSTSERVCVCVCVCVWSDTMLVCLGMLFVNGTSSVWGWVCVWACVCVCVCLQVSVAVC